MTLYAVDPGTLQSALVVCRRGGPFGLEVVSARMVLNGALIAELQRSPAASTLVIERFAALGMKLGEESIETIIWSGRFFEAWPAAHTRFWLTRRAVKSHLCGTQQAKDANVRAVLMDRFGGAASVARATKGTKRKPGRIAGPLGGLTAHHWAALGVAVTWMDQHPPSLPGGAGGLYEAFPTVSGGVYR
jgi:hypothetical protein